MREMAWRHFQSLYSSMHLPSLQYITRAGFPSIQVDDLNFLFAPLLEDEIRRSLFSMGNLKALGMMGYILSSSKANGVSSSLSYAILFRIFSVIRSWCHLWIIMSWLSFQSVMPQKTWLNSGPLRFVMSSIKLSRKLSRIDCSVLWNTLSLWFNTVLC